MYEIKANGAGMPTSSIYSSADGAVAIGKFWLSVGDIKTIVVGQVGMNERSGHGGTFVIKGEKEILLIAGGAGGGHSKASLNQFGGKSDGNGENTQLGHGGTGFGGLSNGGGGFLTNAKPTTEGSTNQAKSYFSGSMGGEGAGYIVLDSKSI